MTFPSPELRKALSLAVREAGQLILHYRAQGVRPDIKEDGTVVTDADRAADHLLVAALAQIDPDTPVVSEEGKAFPEAQRSALHWLVDPLDGTRGFLRGGDDFTVNVALVEKGTPLFGFLLHPPTERLYAGGRGIPAEVEDAGGVLHPLKVRPIPTEGPTVLSSAHHRSSKVAKILSRIESGEHRSFGSALKFCHVAEGKADVYFRGGPTMEWDTAAGHAVLVAAGGSVQLLDETPLVYGKLGRTNSGFVAESSPAWRRFLHDMPETRA